MNAQLFVSAQNPPVKTCMVTFILKPQYRLKGSQGTILNMMATAIVPYKRQILEKCLVEPNFWFN